MDYLNFEKSMNSYINELQNEYLLGIPHEIIADKELFIKWSKKFNLTRGSHASYKFLFKVLYGEQGTEIYLPKDNVLRTSDGRWVSGESTMLLTNSGNINNIIYKKIKQEIEVLPGVFKTATAVVQRAKNSYRGRYNLIEIAVTDIVGEFDFNYPVTTEDGSVEEYILPTISDVVITNGGTGYRDGQRVYLDNVEPLVVSRAAESEAQFDTRITSYLTADDIQVRVNTIPIDNFAFDGRYISSSSISVGDLVEVTFPVYTGFLIINDIDSNGSVKDIQVLDNPVGVSTECSLVTIDEGGSGFIGCAKPGASSEIPGYYIDTRGQLSSNMYLHDSSYHQDYSYVIKTQQQIEEYGQVVKDVLHPAGFAMFGLMNIEYFIQLLINLQSFDINLLPTEVTSLPYYHLGANYSFRDRFKSGLSKRLYKDIHFDDKPFVQGSEYRKYMDDGIIENISSYMNNEQGYSSAYSFRYDDELATGQPYICEDLTDYQKQKYDQDPSKNIGCRYKLINNSNPYRAFIYTSEYYFKGFIDDNYFEGEEKDYPKSWMTKDDLSDYHLFIPQEYSQEVESGFQYFETGYVSTRLEA